MNFNKDNLKQSAIEVLQIEAAAVGNLSDNIGDTFMQAVECLHGVAGKVVCMGVGKSAHIAAKAAATLSSTGTAAFFMHPNDAGHGDLGMVDKRDALLVFSYSGESREVIDILPALKNLQIPIVAIVGSEESTLAKSAKVVLLSMVEKEACPHNLAPTASTTASLALADALAMTLLLARGFSTADFARTHPAGKLGRRLLLRVSDVMCTGEAVPQVTASATLADTLLEMTSKCMGMTLIVDNGQLAGIFTDGDLRRLLKNGTTDFAHLQVSKLMNTTPTTIAPHALAVDAIDLMRTKKINQLPVVDGGNLVGALSIHDLLKHNIA